MWNGWARQAGALRGAAAAAGARARGHWCTRAGATSRGGEMGLVREHANGARDLFGTM
eukprot:COSAG06_NODE_43109_length_375_cov_0.699275_1_plen_57_part_10